MCPKVSLCRKARIKTSPLNLRKINWKKRTDGFTTPFYPTCNKKNICLFTYRGNHDDDYYYYGAFVIMIMIMALLS